MNGKGQALSLHKLVEPGPRPVSTRARQLSFAPQGTAWDALALPCLSLQRSGPHPERHARPSTAFGRQPGRQRPKSSQGPRAPTPARCRKTNLSHGAVTPAARRRARASCTRACPRAAFQSLLPQLSITSPSAPAASWALPPAGWRLPRRRLGSAPP